MPSIRQQISIRLLVGSSALLLVAGLVLGVAMHHRLVAELDHTLATKVRALAALTSLEDGFIEFDFSPTQMPEFNDADSPEYFELRLPAGRLLVKSPSLGEAELPSAALPENEAVYRNVVLPGGRRGRLARLLVPLRTDEPESEATQEDDEAEGAIALDAAAPAMIAVTVARARTDLDQLLWGLYGTLAGVGILLLGGLAFLTRHAVLRGLQPIDTINAQVRGIGPQALEDRVVLNAPPDELRAIVTAINGLLARLHHAFDKERRFSSDVAHELRTPVAELRAASEVGRRWPENPADTRQFFDDVHEIAAQMERIVTNLLTLAQCDERSNTLKIESVPLVPLVRACGERALRLAAGSTLGLELPAGPDATVQTDRGKLEMIVQNLFDNAAAYRVPNSPVRCRIDRESGRIELRVENDVAALSREDVAHLTDRFWRKDTARTGGAHAGLGLSIAQALSELLHIGLHVELSDEQVFRVRLSFAASG